MIRNSVFGPRAALVAVACALAVAAVLAALAADEARATAPHNGRNGHIDPALRRSLDAAFEKSFRQSGAPGAVAAVRTPQGTWVRTLGVAELDSEKPMRADVHHRIGSVTKTFTVSLLLQAAAKGLLSLDDPIGKYVRGVPNGDEITLRQLANMSSGVASYTLNEEWQEELFRNPKRVWKPEQLVRVGLEGSPVFEPGTGWQYSNTNTVLLGLVLEKVTRKSVGRLYRDWIFRPLGLRQTSFPNTNPRLPKPHARGYTLQGQSGGEPVDATNWNPSWAWTAGGMISTACRRTLPTGRTASV